MTTYNGFKNWNEWNVVLWINNDEGLYNYAQRLIARHGKVRAAQVFWNDYKGLTTPDGARYTLTAIKKALAD